MKDTKRRLESFGNMAYTQIAAHLEAMAAKGWMLEKITNFGWVYRRTEPQKLTFSVVYDPRASVFDPEPTEEQREFQAFCAHTGWEFTASAGSMQIYRNGRTDPIPIETDPVIEVDIIHKAAKKSYLPLYFLLLALAVWDMVLVSSQLSYDLIGTLASTSWLLSMVTAAVLFLISAGELVQYYLWVRRARRAAERGERVPSPDTRPLQMTCLVLLLGILGWYLGDMLLSGRSFWLAAAVFSLLGMLAVLAVTGGVKSLLQEKKVSRGVNRAVTYGICMVLTVAVTMAVPLAILPIDFDPAAVEGDSSFTSSGAGAPLRMSDLAEVDDEAYEISQWVDRSPLLRRTQVHFFPREKGASLPWTEYTLVDVRFPALYNLCLRGMLSEHRDEMDGGQVVFTDHYEAAEAAPWRAQEAYQLRWSSSDLIPWYLLCYEDRIVEISFDHVPTAGEMAAVGEKLG